VAGLRIVIADDHPLFRCGLKMILAERSAYHVIGEAADGLELLAILKEGEKPDAVIVDMSMPKLRGIEAIREIRRLSLDVRVLVLTMHKEEEFLCQAFLAGADGYLLKEELAKELFIALDTVLQGKAYVSPLLAKELQNSWLSLFITRKETPVREPLSSKEIEVLKLLALGQTNQEIAEKLHVERRAIGYHRMQMMSKLHLKRTTDLVDYAISKGYLS
jgi:DNA-binding NarL/FixJ family response regulator